MKFSRRTIARIKKFVLDNDQNELTLRVRSGEDLERNSEDRGVFRAAIDFYDDGLRGWASWCECGNDPERLLCSLLEEFEHACKRSGPCR